MLKVSLVTEYLIFVCDMGDLIDSPFAVIASGHFIPRLHEHQFCFYLQASLGLDQIKQKLLKVSAETGWTDLQKRESRSASLQTVYIIQATWGCLDNVLPS